MAVFGTQLVISMIIATFFAKISPYYSFGRWLLTRNLHRYLPPSDDELRHMAHTPKEPTKPRRRRRGEEEDTSFMIPRTTPIELLAVKLRAIDAIQLKFYVEYQWLIDFSFTAMAVYVLSELYESVLSDGTEFNLSMIWCTIGVVFCVHLLYSLTRMFFKLSSEGERSICLTAGLLFLVIAMIVLVIDESILEFGLNSAHEDLATNARAFLDQQGVSTVAPVASKFFFKFCLAIISALLGAFLTFPGLRLARMYVNSLKLTRENRFRQLVLHMNFMTPIVILLMWVKPFGRDQLTLPQRGKAAFISEPTFEQIRLFLIAAYCVIRFLLFLPHIQAYLNTAHERIVEIKKESGRVSNKEIQQSVNQIFAYMCVVVLHYITPVVMVLMLWCMLKTLGGYTWSGTFVDWRTKLPASNATETASTLSWFKLRNLFSPVLFRGLLTYLLWWVLSAHFAASALGLVYYSYIQE